MNESTTPLTAAENRASNQQLVELLDAGQDKKASAINTTYIRRIIREDGFYRRLFNPTQVLASDLQRDVVVKKPMVVIDVEPLSPASYSLPFGATPGELQMFGARCRLVMDRITTQTMTVDTAELATYSMDLRQVMSDQILRDYLAEEDSKLIQAVQTCLVGANVVTPNAGSVQWKTQNGGVTSVAISDSFNLMQGTISSIPVETILINNLTMQQIVTAVLQESDGALLERVMKDGFAETEYLGKRLIVTIKRSLVPTGTFYHFGPMTHLGVGLFYEDITMALKKERYFIQFGAYGCGGMVIGNVNAVGRVDMLP